MSQASVVTSGHNKKVDFVYFGAYDATTEYVVLEFDFKSFLLNTWREATSRISTHSFGEISNVQSDNHTILIRIGSNSMVYVPLTESDCASLFLLFNTIIENAREIMDPSSKNIENYCREAQPKLCLRALDVSQKSFKLIKPKRLKNTVKSKTGSLKKSEDKVSKKSISFLVSTEKYLLCFEDRNNPVPLYVLPNSAIQMTESSDEREFGFKSPYAKASFHCKDGDERSLWMDAFTKSKAVTEAEINELYPIVRDIRFLFQTTFDKVDEEHVNFLRRLWESSDLEHEAEKVFDFQIKCDRWKDLGFQRDDPVSDFRATGLIGLQNLVYFAEEYNPIFMRMARNQQQSSDMEYPFCTAGINLTYLLIELLGLKAHDDWYPNFQLHPLFFYNKNAWEELYGIIFRLFDQKWNQMKVGYMGFQKVIDATRGTVSDLLKKPNVVGVPAIFDMLGIFLEDLQAFRADPAKQKPSSSYKLMSSPSLSRFSSSTSSSSSSSSSSASASKSSSSSSSPLSQTQPITSSSSSAAPEQKKEEEKLATASTHVASLALSPRGAPLSPSRSLSSSNLHTLNFKSLEGQDPMTPGGIPIDPSSDMTPRRRASVQFSDTKTSSLSSSTGVSVPLVTPSVTIAEPDQIQIREKRKRSSTSADDVTMESRRRSASIKNKIFGKKSTPSS